MPIDFRAAYHSFATVRYCFSEAKRAIFRELPLPQRGIELQFRKALRHKPPSCATYHRLWDGDANALSSKNPFAILISLYVSFVATNLSHGLASLPANLGAMTLQGTGEHRKVCSQLRDEH
jgi:hypothetical protein